MKRLYELSDEDIEAWRKARLEHGRAKYGDSHLRRYGLVDIAEEILDAINIFVLHHDHRFVEDLPMTIKMELASRWPAIIAKLWTVLDMLRELDAFLPECVVTDENGSDRIWWNQKGA